VLESPLAGWIGISELIQAYDTLEVLPEAKIQLNVQVLPGARCHQLSVVKQRRHASCGFHALRNVRESIGALEGPSAVQDTAAHRLMCLRRMAVAETFEEDFYRMKRQMDGCASFDFELEILEEEQMHWAVQHTTGCALLGQPPDRVTVLMDFVTRNDYNTPKVIEEYQQTIQQLLDGTAKSVGFAVGCFNHWISFAASTASGSLEILLSDSQNRTVFRFSSSEECVQAHEDAEERDKDSFIRRELNHLDASQAQKEHWWMYGVGAASQLQPLNCTHSTAQSD